MASIVVYGGSFNPIHNGHLGICRWAKERFGADRVLLVPAAYPPHKLAPDLAPGEDRAAMCRLAAEGLPWLSVEDFELNRGGKSYTVDTMTYLREKYPHDRLLLMMGTDMFLTFREWRQWQEIGGMAELLVASRQEDDLDALRRQQKTLEEEGIHSILMENPVEELSSTEVRQQLRDTRKSDRVPPTVLSYIQDHELYRAPYDLEQLRALVRPLLSDYRFHHTLCVEQQAAHLAQLYGCDPNLAAAGGILHDVCKNMDKDVLLQMVLESGIINEIQFRQQPQLLHSYAGALYIQKQWGITDQRLVGAVRYHTTARKGMTLLERIVYLADLTSSDRHYPDVEEMRQRAERSLEDGVYGALQFIVADLAGRGELICRDTIEAYNEYCLKKRNGGFQ
ncbi:nicotinate (nicotinamide) nucleotide adenylyltransferase [Angelakisella massiliensis]|uniref:nicotinate (nicotinamide) nucleotide adenylyltransferase n=1 Tax=Angelakisella massiliensis TaxID=1871018 RepID=UPI0008F81783|nr:nicotinate (nicotinamide) nucleotide adenylyltransferase [Angelakisella massiliensis]